MAHAAFESASRAVGRDREPRDVWVVGDTVNDINCARAVGMNVIAVATGGVEYEHLASAQPDRLLTDLRSVDPIVDLLP